MDTQFNKKIFQTILGSGKINLENSILVVGGSQTERDCFIDLGFKNVTISNIAPIDPALLAPFPYSIQNINHLTFSDHSFDFVFVSASLHHCSSPVQGVLEMYRVAKKGIVITEARDSFTMKLGQKLKLIPTYEIEAVTSTDFVSGGVDDTAIPNYIYRWTERELTKIVNSYNPVGAHTFLFFYKFAPSFMQAKIMGQPMKYILLKTTALLMKPFMFLLKKQGNTFGTVILKPRIPEDLFPWLKMEGEKVIFDRGFRG